MAMAGALLLALAILFAFFPDVLVYPVIVIFTWVALTLFYKGFKLHRKHRRDMALSRQSMVSATAEDRDEVKSR